MSKNFDKNPGGLFWDLTCLGWQVRRTVVTQQGDKIQKIKYKFTILYFSFLVQRNWKVSRPFLDLPHPQHRRREQGTEGGGHPPRFLSLESKLNYYHRHVFV